MEILQKITEMAQLGEETIFAPLANVTNITIGEVNGYLTISLPKEIVRVIQNHPDYFTGGLILVNDSILRLYMDGFISLLAQKPPMNTEIVCLDSTTGATWVEVFDTKPGDNYPIFHYWKIKPQDQEAVEDEHN